MKIIINGKPQDMSYDDICAKLGFIADVRFVEVTSQGKITFTAGKANEISALFRAALDNGMQLSKEAQATAREHRWYNFVGAHNK